MMQVVAWDTETALIRPALLAPPLACVTWQRPGMDPRIATECKPLVSEWLANPEALLVGHNVAYDLGVIGAAFPDLVPSIFRAYDQNRVTDTMLRQQLLDIAAGVYRGRTSSTGYWITHEYTLEALAKRCAGIVLQKDAWRLSYGSFIGVPLAKWPARAVEVQAEAAEQVVVLEARAAQVTDEDDAKSIAKELDGLRSMVASDPSQCVTYPLDDARATLAVYQAQEQHRVYLDDQYRQSRAAFWLHLSSAWGLRTDAEGVAILRRETQAALDEIEVDLVALGIVRKDGSRDTKKAKQRMLAACAESGRKVRRTAAHAEGEGLSVLEQVASGRKPRCKTLDGTPLDDGADECEEHVCLDSDACAASEDQLLIDYAELSTLKKTLSNDIPALEAGIVWPVHTRYGLAETGRTTSSKPNIQNLRRRAGIREAFVPRPGRVFMQADYPQLELYTLAQCCVSWFGASKLADALNAGLDPHLAVAAQILGIPYEEAAKNKKRKDVDDARQIGKVANFGFPGGLGIEKLILFARKTYGVILTPESAKALKATWIATWPEMQHHFARVNSLCANPEGLATVETLWTRRFRGGATYCAACNNGFQALGVDCAKEAGWRITRAMYAEPDSVLYGSRLPAFVHDEFIGETDDTPQAHDCAYEMSRLMVEGANIYLPDVKIKLAKMEPLLMRRWSKKAEPCFDSSGRLVPWAPKAA
jgi:DNA polymerase-1